MTRFFISYDRDDRPLTRQLAAQLRRVYGFDDVWFDENIYGGADWWQEIRKQIASCDIFIFLLSDESATSPYCEKERAEAERLKKEILPVRIAPVKEIPPQFRQIQYVDMSEGKITVENFTELNAAIRQIAKRMASDTMQVRAVPNQRTSRLIWVLLPVSLLAVLVLGLVISAPQRPFQGEITYTSGRTTTVGLFAEQGGFPGVLSNLLGQNPRQIPGQFAADSNFSWRHDGSRLAFAAQTEGISQLFTMNADGGDIQLLSDNPTADDFNPAWSPDGSRIVFTSERDGNQEIYVIDAAGGTAVNLTNNPASDDSFAVWSPDGTQLVFASNRDGDWDLYLMNADGSDLILLTENDVDDQAPVWSPDGTQLAYQSNRVRKLGPGNVPGSGGSTTARNWDIYILVLDGGGSFAVTRSPAADQRPTWSPDGAQIAFISDRNGDNDIYLKNLSDRNRDILLIDEVEGVPFPAWRS
ncbi:MAG: TIR domain-containing protein [Anaerolineae bacterium]|nr:TIR domain-containing protein [Anaerolineae bacterium]